jgi:hypothetical protein
LPTTSVAANTKKIFAFVIVCENKFNTFEKEIGLATLAHAALVLIGSKRLPLFENKLNIVFEDLGLKSKIFH